jgi:S1-C subfamily serine protease
MVLTNADVVSACEVIPVTAAAGEQSRPQLPRLTPKSSLALLWGKGAFDSAAAFRLGRPLRLGEGTVSLGHPLQDLLAAGVNASTSAVSALAGLANHSMTAQSSARVQPCNSGEPVLDLPSAIIGIVASNRDAIKMATAIADIPQNVNFAIKAAIAWLLLE